MCSLPTFSPFTDGHLFQLQQIVVLPYTLNYNAHRKVGHFALYNQLKETNISYSCVWHRIIHCSQTHSYIQGEQAGVCVWLGDIYPWLPLVCKSKLSDKCTNYWARTQFHAPVCCTKYSIHFSIPHQLAHWHSINRESSSYITTNKYHSCKHSLNTLLQLWTQVLMSVREFKNSHRHKIRTSVWKVSTRNHTIRCRASQIP